MTCEEVRDELVAYLREELDEARRAAVEEHLVRCEGCSRELEGLRRVMALTQMADEPSIRELAEELIQTALAGRAGDLHLERGGEAVRLRFRIDGRLLEQAAPVIPPEQYEPLVARLKLMARLNLAEKQVPQEGSLRFPHAGQEFDLSVSVFPYAHGEGVVMRIVNRSDHLIGLDQLGLTPRALTQVEALLARSEGMIMVTGPTGAGKTTLLYSMLQQRNQPDVKIMTIEEPIGALLEGVNQASTNPAAGLTFAKALTALPSQDPDIVMISNFKDLESLSLSLDMASSGRLVLGAMHMPDSTSALTRLVDLGLPPPTVAVAMAGVIAVRVVRRVCPACREPYQPGKSLLQALGFTAANWPDSFFHGAGCNQCGGTGYQGRTGLFEVLTLNTTLTRMLAEKAPEELIRARALELDLLYPFVADARTKIAEGLTTAEEIDRVLPLYLARTH